MAKKKRLTSLSSTSQGESHRKKRNKMLGNVASAMVLGSILLATEPCRGSDYELSFIKVEKKPRESARALMYRESASAVRKQAALNLNRQQSVRPEYMENYFDALLLDFKAMDHQVALVQCGYCNCASCICPNVLCSACTSCSSCAACLSCTACLSCISACTCPCPADCKACACACACSCDCDCDCP